MMQCGANAGYVSQCRGGRCAARVCLLSLLACLAAATPARAQPPGKSSEVSFDDIKFDIEKDGDFKREMLTKKIEDLNEQKIRIRGFILPASVFQQKGIKQFVLVRDNMQCCFGPGAAIYDCIMIEMDEGSSADFTTRPIAVEGVFRIKEYKYPSGKAYAIYHIQAGSAK